MNIPTPNQVRVQDGEYAADIHPGASSLTPELAASVLNVQGFTAPFTPSGPTLTVIRQESDAEVRERLRQQDVNTAMTVAETFAAHVRDKPGVEEIWVAQDDLGTIVTVITADFNLDRDLELQAAFSAALRGHRPDRECDLDIIAVPEGVPADIRNGRRL